MTRLHRPLAALALALGATGAAGCDASRELNQQPLQLATAAADARAQHLWQTERATPVYDELHRELGAAVHDLEVTERDGLVRLYGVVPSLWHEERALIVALADPQVRAVVDAIDVALLAVDDDDLARDVLEKIAATPPRPPSPGIWTSSPTQGTSGSPASSTPQPKRRWRSPPPNACPASWRCTIGSCLGSPRRAPTRRCSPTPWRCWRGTPSSTRSTSGSTSRKVRPPWSAP